MLGIFDMRHQTSTPGIVATTATATTTILAVVAAAVIVIVLVVRFLHGLGSLQAHSIAVFLILLPPSSSF